MSASQKENTLTIRIWTILAAVIATFAVATPSAGAAFEIEAFDGGTFDALGNAASQAGGHPASASASIEVGERVPDPLLGVPIPAQMMRRLTVELPPGLVGNPQAVDMCTRGQLLDGANNGGSCPLDTQAGLVRLTTSPGYVWTPLYRMEPPVGSPVAFGFNFNSAPVMITASIRTGTDYGINLESRNISQAAPILGSKVILWGTPASPENDPFRFGQEGSLRRACLNTEPISEEPVSQGDECHVNGPPVALVTNPTACPPDGVGIETRLQGESWNGELDSASFLSHEPPGFPASPEAWGPQLGPTGCGNVPFAPTLRLEPSSRAAGAPTGLAVELRIPQDGFRNPSGLASSALRDVEVLLPEGMTVNASAAEGLGGCFPQDVGLTSSPGATPVTFTREAADCPDSSKIGTVQIETPLLEETLEGGVYLASQGSNPFNSLLALYVAIDDPQTGVVLKLPGRVISDPATGRLTASFSQNPQLPFETLRMQLKGGSRAALVNPPECGRYTTHAELSSWARPDESISSDSSFAVNQSCGSRDRFEPTLEAGSANPLAGRTTPFMLRVTRPDGQANLSAIEATLPEGVLAKLAGVPLCGEPEAESGNCPLSSQVGTTTVAAGSGASPVYIPQPGRAPTGVYLAGPYAGAPYSLVVRVPAQAGPFDLGIVVVRTALYVNPTSAQVTAKSDPLPQILQGIPIAYRDVRVEITRSHFVVNPTSCEPMAVTAVISSAAGQAATPSSRFQVGACGQLGFQPRLSLRFIGKTHRSAHPKLRATLTMPKGNANIGKAVVTLPKTEFLENAHIRTICTRVQYAAESCPKASVYGYAKAFTPLLDEPLQGPVYLRSSNHKLPDLVADLNGQIEIDLAGRIDSPKGRIRNTFWAVPDAPVSKFVLTMQGGKKGLLVNNTELCRAKPRAKAEFTGQNGKRSVSNPLVKTSCGKR